MLPTFTPTFSHPRNFLIGFLLVCFAHYLMTQDAPFLLTFTFMQQLNDLYQFEVGNLDNAMMGIVLIVIGLWLMNGAFRLEASAAWQANRLYPDELTKGLSPLSGERVQPLRGRLTGLAALLVIAALVLFGVLVMQLHAANSSNTLVAVWVASLVLAATAALLADRQRQVALSPVITRTDLLILLTMLMIGGLVASYWLDEIPNSLMGDEGVFWEKAYGMYTNPSEQSFFDFGAYSYPVASSHLQLLFINLFGASLWTWRFSSVVVSVLTVIPLYLLARDLFDRRTALLTLIVFITLPYLLAFGRMGYNNAQALFPVTLCLYCLYTGLKKRSLLYMAVGGFAAGIGFYTYTAGRHGALVAALFFAGLLLHQLYRMARAGQAEMRTVYRQRFGGIFALGVVYGGMIILTAVPHLVYGSAVQPDMLRYKTLESLFPNTHYGRDLYGEGDLFRDYPAIELGTEQFFFRADLYVILIVRGVVRTFLGFHHNTIIREHFIAGPMTGVLSALFYPVGLVVLWKLRRSAAGVLLILWVISGVTLLSILNTFPPRHAHLVSIIPLITLLVAFGVMTIAVFVQQMIAQQPETAESETSDAPATQTAFAPSAGTTWLGTTIIGLFTAGIVAGNLYNYFVIMPGKYQPNLENLIAFEALQYEQERGIVYVTMDEDRGSFKPWLILNIPNKALYRTILAEDLNTQKANLIDGIDYEFFFDGTAAEAVLAYLEAEHGRVFIPMLHQDSEGKVIGYRVLVPAKPLGERLSLLTP